MKIRGFEDVMELLENVTDKVTEKAESFADTSAEKFGLIKEATEDILNLSNAKKDLENAYIELGKAVYEKASDGSSLYLKFKNELNEVTEAKENLEKFDDIIRTWRNVKVCECCQTEVPISSKFCPECGEEFCDEDYDENGFCPHCGEEISSEQHFCSQCGFHLK